MSSHVPRIRTQLSLPDTRRVRSLLEGQYASSVLGRGMDFNDLREYVRGDDVKDLDWKASARSGAMLVRRYVTLRQHHVVLVVSTGRSMAAAHTLEATKREAAVQVAGLVGWLAVRHGDVVGTVYGDAAHQHAVRARTGELHLERCLDAVHTATTPEADPSDLAALLRYVARTVRRRAIMLVVTDQDEATPEITTVLRRLAVQHQLLVVTIGDVDPVSVPAGTPPAHDVVSDDDLPSWLRGDVVLAAELRNARQEANVRLHDHLTTLGVTHEHLAPGTTPLTAVRRLVTRSGRARD